MDSLPDEAVLRALVAGPSASIPDATTRAAHELQALRRAAQTANPGGALASLLAAFSRLSTPARAAARALLRERAAGVMRQRTGPAGVSAAAQRASIALALEANAQQLQASLGSAPAATLARLLEGAATDLLVVVVAGPGGAARVATAPDVAAPASVEIASADAEPAVAGASPSPASAAPPLVPRLPLDYLAQPITPIEPIAPRAPSSAAAAAAAPSAAQLLQPPQLMQRSASPAPRRPRPRARSRSPARAAPLAPMRAEAGATGYARLARLGGTPATPAPELAPPAVPAVELLDRMRLRLASPLSSPGAAGAAALGRLPSPSPPPQPQPQPQRAYIRRQSPPQAQHSPRARRSPQKPAPQDVVPAGMSRADFAAVLAAEAMLTASAEEEEAELALRAAAEEAAALAAADAALGGVAPLHAPRVSRLFALLSRRLDDGAEARQLQLVAVRAAARAAEAEGANGADGAGGPPDRRRSASRRRSRSPRGASATPGKQARGRRAPPPTPLPREEGDDSFRSEAEAAAQEVEQRAPERQAEAPPRDQDLPERSRSQQQPRGSPAAINSEFGEEYFPDEDLLDESPAPAPAAAAPPLPGPPPAPPTPPGPPPLVSTPLPAELVLQIVRIARQSGSSLGLRQPEP